MQTTDYSRKMDSAGRVIIPSKLRDSIGLQPGQVCNFFVHEENGKTYLCIECPHQKTELEKAYDLLKENGFTIKKEDN